MTVMTDKERAEIRRHIRDREKLAKAMAAERSAAVLVEFERQVSAIYRWSDSEVWSKAHAMAERAVDEASRAIDAESERLGIPTIFRPSIHLGWSSRGENAVAARVRELRRVAKAEIDRIEEHAKVAIEHAHLHARVKLVEHGLHSPEAKEFLASLPTVESLIPPLQYDCIEQLMLRDARNPSRYWNRPEIGADALEKSAAAPDDD
jgi:hypothetical protein